MMRPTIIAGIVLFASCSARTDRNIYQSWPDANTLFDNFRKAGKELVIYPASDPALGESLQNLARRFSDDSGRFTMLVKKDEDVSPDDLRNNPLYILGNYQENAVLKRINDIVPVHFGDNGFSFEDSLYKSPDNLISLSFYPNPFNPQLPLSFVTGNSGAAVDSFVERTLHNGHGWFHDGWGYVVYLGSQKILLGNFSMDSATRWQTDPSKQWHFDYSGHIAGQNAHFFFVEHGVHITASELDTISARTERQAAAMEAFTGRQCTQKFNFHLYPSSEIKTFMTNNPQPCSVNLQTMEAHVALAPEFAGSCFSNQNILVLRALLGKPSLGILETGLSVYFSEGWQKYGYGYWAKRLFDSGNFPSLNDLLQENPDPDYIDACASAVLVAFLTDHYGNKTFTEKYDSLNAGDVSALETRWLRFLQSYCSSMQTISVSLHPDPLPDHIKGFNFAHEGYQIYNGYMGSASDSSLSTLRALGTNAIAVIPYGGFRSLHDPDPFQFPGGAGEENDAAVIHTIWEARNLGMSVMLKPQLWSGAGWDGDIDMQNKQDWDLFFAYYHRWILNYALLAEMYHVDILCLGVEMKDASKSHPAAFEALIRQIRGIYTGKLTYAANWYGEFSEISFWDKLDFISINCYYPLSSRDKPDDAELLARFEKNLDTIACTAKQYNKPVLITEIGFKSIDCPWKFPHADSDDQNLNFESQKRCYQAMFEALQQADWIKGIYIWKWPSDMEYTKENPKDFTPCGKPAEQLVSRYFGGKSGQ